MLSEKERRTPSFLVLISRCGYHGGVGDARGLSRKENKEKCLKYGTGDGVSEKERHTEGR